jgi:hypothetical protein
MQAGRFEALDSMRGEGNMSLTAHANLLVSRIKQIWNIHYSTSKVQIYDWDLKIINVPLQGNMYVEWFLFCFSSFFLFLLHMYVFYIDFLSSSGQFLYISTFSTDLIVDTMLSTILTSGMVKMSRHRARKKQQKSEGFCLPSG